MRRRCFLGSSEQPIRLLRRADGTDSPTRLAVERSPSLARCSVAAERRPRRAARAGHADCELPKCRGLQAAGRLTCDGPACSRTGRGPARRVRRGRRFATSAASGASPSRACGRPITPKRIPAHCPLRRTSLVKALSGAGLCARTVRQDSAHSGVTSARPPLRQ